MLTLIAAALFVAVVAAICNRLRRGVSKPDAQRIPLHGPSPLGMLLDQPTAQVLDELPDVPDREVASPPAPRSQLSETVLCVDIVEFSTHFAGKGQVQIRKWMERIQKTIDLLIAKHAIQRIEASGHCCICVSRSSDQATRLCAFATELASSLLQSENTKVCIGMATGMCPGAGTIGDHDTVNLACRVAEQKGFGSIQLSEAAQQLLAEEQCKLHESCGATQASLQEMEIDWNRPKLPRAGSSCRITVY